MSYESWRLELLSAVVWFKIGDTVHSESLQDCEYSAYIQRPSAEISMVITHYSLFSYFKSSFNFNYLHCVKDLTERHKPDGPFLATGDMESLLVSLNCFNIKYPWSSASNYKLNHCLSGQ